MNLQRFDPLDFPLDGLQLIEASAGTGKTFSLAGLFLRLLLEKRLEVSQILVITFTRAATQELRSRIRDRLVSAARIAADPQAAVSDSAEDQLALALIEQARSVEKPDDIARRLKTAALHIDEAAIATLHQFAQRAMAEQAFDSGIAFDRGEQVDDASVYGPITADYWRQQALGPDSDPAFLEWFADPAHLDSALARFRHRPHAQLAGALPQAELARLCATLRDHWKKHGAAFQSDMQNFWAANAFMAKSLKKSLEVYESIDAALMDLSSAIASETVPPRLPAWVTRLADAATQFKKKFQDDGARFLDQPLIHAMQALAHQPRLQALAGAGREINRRAREHKRLHRQYSFADMIGALHEAVHRKDSGAALCASLKATWPWMLVDEFQDTDPQQYDVLRRIHQADDGGGLLLIGDPKQAIYGFRGGDVYAYLDAAAEAGQQRFGLERNFRSTRALIEGVETLFATPKDDAFLVDGIEYQSVKPGRSDERWLTLDGKTRAAGLNIWRLAPHQPAKSDAERLCLQATVSQINHLLDQNGSASLCRQTAAGEREQQAVGPSDIAVLVNTNRQAADMQSALASSGVAAVCVHQQSVFATEQASELLRILMAAENPTSEDLVRGALASRLLGYRLGQIIALREQEADWQTQIERIQTGAERWQRHGILALLQPLIQDGAQRMLRLEDGERRMSNYLQLAELLAQAESESFGTAGLLQWLRDAIQRAAKGEATEAEQLRLESDEALVRIVTVHRAKGLEYPIVFLPFAPWLGGLGKPTALPHEFHDAQRRAQLCFSEDSAAQAQSIREARAEGLRLLYVALTRAAIACYLPWGAVTLAANSALASLLHREDGIDPTFWTGNTRSAEPLDHHAVSEALRALESRAPKQISVTPLPETFDAVTAAEDSADTASEARTDLPPPALPWSVFSFTRLLRAGEPGPATAGAADEAATEAVDQIGHAGLPSGRDMSESPLLPDLPGGTGFGSAVHDLLETAIPTHWQQAPQQDPECREAIRRSLRRYGLVLDETGANEVIDGISSLITQTLYTPIPGIGRLAELPAARKRAEMEFMFRLRGERLNRFQDVLSEAGYLTRLPREQSGLLLRGLMHGFIDLIVEQDGRFHVIDYKTNWLGPRLSDYQPAALKSAIAEHHYDLQYLIYSVALHRYLRQRLPDYAPARHLGGVHYLFVRGMRANGGECGIFSDNPDAALIEALDALLDNAQPAERAS